MLLGGLWHGAAWTFVVWGLLHGLYLGFERLLRNKIKITINAWNGILLAFLTYTCINITWVFFRAREFDTAANMLASMFFFNMEGEKVLDYLDIVIVLLVSIGLFLCHWFMRNTSVREVATKIPQWVLGLFWGAMIILLAIAQGSGEQFIYFQF